MQRISPADSPLFVRPRQGNPFRDPPIAQNGLLDSIPAQGRRGDTRQANNLGKALDRKNGEDHLMAILPTAMIIHLVGMRMARILRGNTPVDEIGWEKFHDALAIHHQATKRWEGILTFVPFRKLVERDERKGKFPVTSKDPASG